MLSMWARISRSEPAFSSVMAASTVSTPYRSSNFVSRFSPTLSAPSCARMSPIRSSATRMLFSTMSMMSWQISPRRTSFTGGRRRPSCTISVAVAEKPPGTMPPVSGQWPVFDR